MALPIPNSYDPMNARLVDELPLEGDWQYEPKWDGFRALVFKDGGKVEMMSKSGQTLGRYFPELVEAVAKLKPRQLVIDGEVVVPLDHSISFDALLQRIHPAASRIKKLSAQTPAVLVVFDMLVDDRGRSLVEMTLPQRHERLRAFARKHLKGNDQIMLSPSTRDPKVAQRWFAGVGGALDGVIAKRIDLPYQSGNRDGMVKVKKMRTADCVVGGFRYASSEKIVGSLLLGLFDGKGLLNHVGFCSTLPAAERRKLTPKLERMIKLPGFTGAAPGGPSRWSTERSTEWQPLATKLVVEVRYDHFSAGRFRHGTKFLRWRPDKAPRQCTMKQIEQESSAMPLRLAK